MASHSSPDLVCCFLVPFPVSTYYYVSSFVRLCVFSLLRLGNLPAYASLHSGADPRLHNRNGANAFTVARGIGRELAVGAEAGFPVVVAMLDEWQRSVVGEVKVKVATKAKKEVGGGGKGKGKGGGKKKKGAAATGGGAKKKTGGKKKKKKKMS